ncbi:3440_t:CDS:2 [Rhizophagus irregularis]|nr:3440_t:CDS:2 [Rhizophagus irregularis]
MVKRALDLKVFNKIILASEFSDLNNIKLSQSDWTSLENIAAFLRYFAKLSTEICASTYPTVTLAANVAWNKLYRFTYKFDEYHSIYYPVSETLNNSLGEDKNSENSLFPVPKQFVIIMDIMSSIVTSIVLQN